MSNTNTGGPAFPTILENRPGSYGTEGITVRDYFAAKAMQAAVTAWNTKSTDCAACVASIISDEAYEIADAMLEARNQ